MNPFHELNKADKLEKLVEKYSLNTEDFIDIEDLIVFINYLEELSLLISEMANFYGKEIKKEKIPFSFFIFTKSDYNINRCNNLSELEGLIRRDHLYNMND